MMTKAPPSHFQRLCFMLLCLCWVSCGTQVSSNYHEIAAKCGAQPDYNEFVFSLSGEGHEKIRATYIVDGASATGASVKISPKRCVFVRTDHSGQIIISSDEFTSLFPLDLQTTQRFTEVRIGTVKLQHELAVQCGYVPKTNETLLYSETRAPTKTSYHGIKVRPGKFFDDQRHSKGSFQWTPGKCLVVPKDTKSLNLSNIELTHVSMASVNSLTNLERLFLANTGRDSYTTLNLTRPLKILDLQANQLYDLAPHNQLDVEELYLDQNEMFELPALSPRLRRLSLGMTNLKHFSGLYRNLEWLRIGSNALEHWDNLAFATNLRELHIGGDSLMNGSFLAKLPNLVVLRIDLNHITDWTPIAKLHNLRSLAIHVNEPGFDLKSVMELTGLESLEIRNHTNSVLKLAELKSMIRMKNLVITGKVDSLDPLTRLISLETLYLEPNHILDKTCPETNVDVITAMCEALSLE